MPRLSVDNFACGTYSTFIHGGTATRLVNSPPSYTTSNIADFNVGLSGSSPVKSHFSNCWLTSTLTLNSAEVPNLIFVDENASYLQALSVNSFGVMLTNTQTNIPYRNTTYNHTTSSYIENGTLNSLDNQNIAIYRPVDSIATIADYLPYVVLGPIKFNYILEFNLEEERNAPNFKIAEAKCNAIHTKNMHNAVYDTETYLVTATFDDAPHIRAGNTNTRLVNCRQYTGANVGSDGINLIYTMATGSGPPFSVQNYAVGADTEVAVDSFGRKSITECSVNSYNTTFSTANDARRYEFAERIKGIVSWQGSLAGKHKSNLFSLRLLNTGLNENISDRTERSKIQNSINTVVRRLITEFIPANTELFSIYWEGK